MYLYALLLFASIVIPLVLSFDRKVHFYTTWKALAPSIFIVGLFFILFDIILTKNGVWGFNPLYHSDILLLNLPIEEWLFFAIVPYACIFIHYVMITYFPKLKLSKKTNSIISVSLIVLFLLVLVFNFDKSYTLFIALVTILALLWSLINKSQMTRSFYISFLIMFIPFLVVDSILTGSFIPHEVVWYNNAENIGIRLFSIPLEDIAFAFSLILLNLLVLEAFTNQLQKRSKSKTDVEI